MLGDASGMRPAEDSSRGSVKPQDAKDGAAALDDGGDGYMAAGEGDEDGAPAQCGNDDDGEGFLGIDTGYDVAEDCARLGPSRVRWCVVLLGKKSSLATLLKCLEQAHGRTVRYGLAWSLTGDGLGPDGQLPEGALEHLPKQRRKLQPPSGEKIQGVPQAPPGAALAFPSCILLQCASASFCNVQSQEQRATFVL
ncbi:hypothetical protein CYMTET_29803 [Cymbomonas tetramitiformis]|uniref:Uncharacterized protein n=1 Tax=Cymbomonas tetramitiformis TaxID=36881 RepID=A0AAE0FKJ6_9CHLO|nr:hypothetical protein CYMTET_29803 [Cymbomonas tetramitiformis]